MLGAQCMASVWQLVSYGLWIAFAAGLGAFIYGVVLRVLCREDYLKYVSGGVAAVLIAAFGWSLIQALYGGATPPVPYGWVFYAVAGVLLVTSAIYLALGRAEGYWSLVGALLVVGLGFFAASLATGIDIGVGGSISIALSPSTTLLKSGEELELTIMPQGGSPPYTSTVDWGDGGIDTAVIYSDAVLVHKYSVPSNRAADSFTIRVNAVDSQGREGFNTIAVVVQNQDYCPFEWPWNAFCSLYRTVSAVLPAIDLQKLTECPLFPSSGKLYDLYLFILGASMSALGLFLAFNLAWGVVSGGDVAGVVVHSIKDAVVVVALALLAPYVYNATAGILNSVTYQLVGRLNIGWVFSWIMLQIALGMALGYFIPFMAQYGALLTFTLFLASVAVYIRYVLILTIAVASPLLAVAYLHPVLKGVVRHMATLLAGLMLAGPLAAVFLVVLSYVVPGQDIVFGVIYPLIVGVLPSVLSVFGAGAVQSLSGAVIGGLRAISGALSVGTRSEAIRAPSTATLIRAEASATPRTVKLRAPSTTPLQTSVKAVGVTPGHMGAGAMAIEAAAPSTTSKPDLSKPGPLITPSIIKAAAEEAELKRGVYEAVAEAQELAPGIALIEKGPGAAEQVARELAGERIRPRWEGFKAFTAELSKLSWRQLKTNVKSLASEYYLSLRNLAERELGVKLPENVSNSFRFNRRSQAIAPSSRCRARRTVRDVVIQAK